MRGDVLLQIGAKFLNQPFTLRPFPSGYGGEVGFSSTPKIFLGLIFMFSPVHVPVGMLLAHSLPGGPLTAFTAGVVSHLLLDALPHGDTGIGHWVASAPTRKIRLQRILPMSAADQMITLCLFLVLIRSPFFQHDSFVQLLAGAAGSVFPDYVTGVRDLLPRPPAWLEKLHRLHDRCHFRGRDPFTIVTGLLFQIGLVLAFLYLAFRT